MSEMVIVARGHAKPGREEDLRKILEAVVGPSHQEEGCLRYALHRGVEDRALFVVIERYRSKGDVDLHMSSSHVQKLFSEIGDLVDAPPEIVFLEPLTDAMGDKGRI